MLQVSINKVYHFFESASEAYVEENYNYNYKQLIFKDSRLQTSGPKQEEIRLLYEKTFPNRDTVFKQLAKMMKRVDKHLTEASIKPRLKSKVRGTFIDKLERAINEVLPEKELAPWPEQ